MMLLPRSGGPGVQTRQCPGISRPYLYRIEEKRFFRLHGVETARHTARRMEYDWNDE